ncbi:F-box protein KIB4 [Frankliniella fusca]|uniref:F-box protein KIB4 n=1 Tax=Frankliniella fusca TaxID=407009 RepID=A0AAE1LCM5_9NEOP|nr:F-box protein KIB4 [Frankliniella fusca]
MPFRGLKNAGQRKLLIRLTKCREMVSSNTCELFQNWRFDQKPCEGMTNPAAPWHSTWLNFDPRPTCPFKPGTYHMRNLTLGASVVDKLPLPWEGNVWLIRFGVLDTKTRFHLCTDTEFRAHRVRD